MDGLGVTAPAPSGSWTTAVVRSKTQVAARFTALRLEVANRVTHLPGQHYVVRLRADDGYTASRSYSVASAPVDPLVELCVEQLDDGEVAGFLADVVEVGDALEVRGPIGGWFVWDGATPALAIGGGSGIVPLVSMLRHARVLDRADLLCLVAATRTSHDLPYAEEILEGCHVVALSQEATAAGRAAGRLTGADLIPFVRDGQVVYVCGSARFAAAASTLLVDLGIPATQVRVERFGPSG